MRDELRTIVCERCHEVIGYQDPDDYMKFFDKDKKPLGQYQPLDYGRDREPANNWEGYTTITVCKNCHPKDKPRFHLVSHGNYSSPSLAVNGIGASLGQFVEEHEEYDSDDEYQELPSNVWYTRKSHRKVREGLGDDLRELNLTCEQIDDIQDMLCDD